MSSLGSRYHLRLARRKRAESRFRAIGLGAVIMAMMILVTLLSSIGLSSVPAFTHTQLRLDVVLKSAPDGVAAPLSPAEIEALNWRALTRDALFGLFPEVTDRREKRKLGQLLSIGAPDQVAAELGDRELYVGQSYAVNVPVSDDFDLLVKGIIDRTVPEDARTVSDQELGWIEQLETSGRISRSFAVNLFANGDSREPELAGIRSALTGTLMTLMVTLAVCLPLGVLTAIYLQELAPRNRFTDAIEVNINNLAAVPSIVFGLLGLAIFINFFHMPRSSPLVGGLVLALMTLPTIIIASRAALSAVPPSIRQAALGVGASPLQVIWHHVLPLALPGILTGTIIGLSQAAGETAPLLMIGMMAFVVDTPAAIGDKATVLPAQVYMWANNPERAFMARTSAAIVILLVFLLSMNALAIYLRHRFERKW